MPRQTLVILEERREVLHPLIDPGNSLMHLGKGNKLRLQLLLLSLFTLYPSYVIGDSPLWLLGCESESTPISEVQGRDSQSPLIDQQVTIEGIVTARFDQKGAINGFFIQSPPNESDNEQQTSEGLFIFLGNNRPYYQVNDRLRITGTVREHHGRTELTKITRLIRCETERPPPPTTPINTQLTSQEFGVLDWEAYEGMLIEFQSPLTVINTDHLKRYGTISVSAYGRLIQPTQRSQSSVDSHFPLLIELDDGLKVIRPDEPLRFIQKEEDHPLENPSELLRGTRLINVKAIVDYSYGTYRLLPVQKVKAIPQDRSPPQSTDLLRVAALNLNNFFNGHPEKRIFPSRRGPKSWGEYLQKRSHIVATMHALKADLYALSEIENDGYDKNSSLYDLNVHLNQIASTPYQFSHNKDHKLGNDEIKVAIIYNSDKLSPIGNSKTYLKAPFQKGNRPPLLQSFQLKNSNTKTDRLHVVVIHLKSKAGCSNNKVANHHQTTKSKNSKRENKDCWQLLRLDASKAIIKWLNKLGLSQESDNIIILGDFNSYYYETPLEHFYQQGFYNSIPSRQAASTYTYNYKQHSGQLDHILLSRYLLQNSEWREKSRTASTWNNFSDQHALKENRANSKWKRTHIDHDPIYVDLPFPP